MATGDNSTPNEKQCPLTFKVDENGDFYSCVCLKSECQCWVLMGGVNGIIGYCGLINRK
jgi:hypothetical protein